MNKIKFIKSLSENKKEKVQTKKTASQSNITSKECNYLQQAKLHEEKQKNFRKKAKVDEKKYKELAKRVTEGNIFKELYKKLNKEEK